MESPSTVTYRAEIHGTENRTSSQLLMDINLWVRSGLSFQVLSVTMSLVSTCQVQIESFRDAKCSTTGTSDGFSIPIIVGAALGGVIVVTVCCIIVIVAVIVARRRKRKKRQITRRHAK